MTIESIIITLSYFGILLLMTSNGIVSFPSSQILYIICGYFIYIGDLSLSLVLISGVIGNTIGNYILYEISRQKGLKYLLKFKFFPEKEIKKIQIVFNKKGAWFLFIGKLLPAIKVLVPIPAGFSKMNRFLFNIIIFISSLIWALIFIYIGYFFGKSSNVFGSFAIILLIFTFILISIFYKFMNSKEILNEIKNQ